ncbi:MAG: thioredoxin [Bacilli bacterium]|nr:thioredoxin [Bacilli bacterium]
MLKHISDYDEFHDSIKEGLVLVDFYTTWCGPCKMLAPILEDMAEEYPQLTVIKVDAEEAPLLSAEFRVNAVPTLIKFQDGKMIEQRAGYMPAPALQRWLGL